MFVQYKTNTTWTPADLVSDVTAILTGTSDVNSLSASCDKANSALLANTTAAGWSLHDNIGGADYARVISAPDYTGSITKYVRIRYQAGYPLIFNISTTWNNVTHTGTDVTTYNCSMSTGSVSTTTPLLLYILVTAEYFAIVGYQSGGWLPGRVMCLELSRTAGFTNSLNAEYQRPNYFLMPSLSNSQLDVYRCATMSRIKSNYTTGDQTNVYEMIPSTLGASTGGSGTNYQFAPHNPGRNNDGSHPGITLMEIPLLWWNGNGSGAISYISTIKSAMTALSYYDPVIAQLDEIVAGSTTYVNIAPSNGYGPSIFLPKV